MASSFAHLHVHTEYSMLDGASRIGEVVGAAKADGQPAIGITDHGNMYGVLDFYKECRDHGLNPIIGSELYMAGESRFERPSRRGRVDDTGGDVEGGQKLYYHLTVLAESNDGYRNLMALSSEAYLSGYFYKPRCLLPGQEIVTRSGVKAIEDVVLGDEVLTHRGRFRKVIQTMSRRHDGDIYGVHLNDRYGRVTWMTGEHPILVREQDGSLRWVEARAIDTGRPTSAERAESWNAWVCLPKIARPSAPIEAIAPADYVTWQPSAERPGYFRRTTPRTTIGPTYHYSQFPDEIPLDYDVGYFLGLYVAEGYTSHGCQVTWTFHEDEHELVDRCVLVAEKLTGKKARVSSRSHRADKHGVDVHCQSAVLAQLLVALCGSGARNKHLPDVVWNAPIDFQRGIVDGVLDGDGARRDAATIFTQTSRDLAWQMRMLRATLRDDFAGVTGRTMASDRHATQYCSTYSPDHRSATYRRTLADGEYVYKPIAEIATKQYSGPVYNIEVEEDHSYVSDFAIHNCDWELLERHHEGLIATTGCLGGVVLQSVLKGDVEDATKKAARLQDIFGRDNLFVELQDHGLAAQRQTNPHLIDIAKRIGAPLLATNDSHYTHRTDAEAHDALLCVQTGALMADTNRFKFESDQHYLKTADEMRHLFRHWEQACDNTLWIAERANVEIEFGKPMLPTFPLPEGFASDTDYLRHLTFEGARHRYGDELTADVVERLDYELGVIDDMGFSSYFLVVWDLIKFARDRGIRVGPGRGSAAGCCVAYCLRIVDLDPIRYDLLFERFLNPGRKQMPDIDMDFDSRYRGEMIKYAADKYGWDRVAQIVTFSTIKARAAVRDAARVLGYPYAVGDKVAKAMPPLVMGRDTPLYACLEKHPKYEDGYKAASELRSLYAADPDVQKVVDVARGLEGMRRQDGIHAAAVVITRDPLTTYLPIQRKPESGQAVEEAPIVTQYEMHGVEELGLLKMDFLGLRNLDVIDMTLDLIEQSHGPGTRPDIDNVPLDDEKTYELLRRGDSIGVFQLEGGPMRALMRSLAPTSFEDVAALVALYRPGPMAANMHNDYADRKNGRKKIEYLHPDLAEILADTQGLMIYQESMMRVAQKFAGYSLEEADNLRKACFPAGTLVLTEKRGYVPIERLAGRRGWRLQTIDTQSCTTRHEPLDDVWSVGVKPVFRLTTSTGYTIEATANHPFLVEGDWRELGDIRRGDLVGVASRTLTDGASKVTDAEVDLAALLISEGCTPLIEAGSSGRAHFCNTDPELLDAFRRAFADHFGYEHARSGECAGVTRLLLRREELRKLAPVLGGFGLSADKQIPLRYVNAPRCKVERFLGLYFCADGWADRSGAHFGSKSKQVCQALKRMLLRFGITSNLLSKTTREHGTHWTLSVSDKSQAKAFAAIVEPHLTVIKARKVDRWLREWCDGSSATNIGIPASFLAKELERRQRVTAKTKRQLGVDSGGYASCKVLHRNTLNGLLYSERLEDLRTGDLVWDTVVSIEPVGERECFDFRMANEERPYAVVEDFLVHNCGKKIRELIAKEREKFESGCEATGYGREIGKKLFDIIEPFADYAFNKSHSVGYGFVAYQTAWLKANYPVEYLAALLTSVKDDKDKTAIYLAECRATGIEVLVPDVNLSASDFIARDAAIPFGLSGIRNVGEGLVGLILEERDKNGPFADFYDFCQRVDPMALNKRTVESLIKAGAFDSMGHPRKGLCLVFEQIVDRTLARRREAEMGVMSLFDDAPVSDEVGPSFDDSRVPIPDDDWDKTDQLRFEKEMLGLYLSDHPLMGAETALRKHTECRLAELRELKDGELRKVGGVVTGLQRKYTKKGDLMAVFTLEDLESAVEVMVFPRTMQEYGILLADDAIVVVRGRLDGREEPAKLVAMEITRPQLVLDGGPPLRLVLPTATVSGSMVEQLKKILVEHPGESPVYLRVGTKTLRLPDEFNVDTSNGVVAELRTVLGEAGVIL